MDRTRSDANGVGLGAAMIGDVSNGETRSRRVKKHPVHNARPHIIENVDAEVCPECGERYFHATTLDKIDELLDEEHAVKEPLQVEIDLEEVIEKAFEQAFAKALDQALQSKAEALFKKAFENGSPLS